MRQVNAFLAIAQRDFMKLLRDPARLVSSLILPLLLVVVLGSALQAGFGQGLNFDLITFTFTGVLIQTVFQSAFSGVISLIADREEDFSQEMFIAPVSRHSIVFGKTLGETLVAMPSGLVILILGFALGVGMSPARAVAMLPALFLACLLGASFGVVVLSNLKNQRSANQVFPFLIFPQFFLGGVFNPIDRLPPFLDALSAAAPLRYAIDLGRSAYYAGTDEYADVVLLSPATNLAIMAAMFTVFLVTGTALFVRKERNR